MLPNDSLNASVGMSVTLSTTLTAQQAPFTIIDWKFKDTTIIYFNEEINITPGYEGKVNISLNTGSLELRNLAVNDSGRYRVIITPRKQPSLEGATTLNVYGEQTLNLSGQEKEKRVANTLFGDILSCSSWQNDAFTGRI